MNLFILNHVSVLNHVYFSNLIGQNVQCASKVPDPCNFVPCKVWNIFEVRLLCEQQHCTDRDLLDMQPSTQHTMEAFSNSVKVHSYWCVQPRLVCLRRVAVFDRSAPLQLHQQGCGGGICTLEGSSDCTLAGRVLTSEGWGSQLPASCEAIQGGMWKRGVN